MGNHSKQAMMQYCAKVHGDFYREFSPDLERKFSRELDDVLKRAKDSRVTLIDLAEGHSMSFANPEGLKLKECGGLVYICRENGGLSAVAAVGKKAYWPDPLEIKAKAKKSKSSS